MSNNGVGRVALGGEDVDPCYPTNKGVQVRCALSEPY